MILYFTRNRGIRQCKIAGRHAWEHLSVTADTRQQPREVDDNATNDLVTEMYDVGRYSTNVSEFIGIQGIVTTTLSTMSVDWLMTQDLCVTSDCRKMYDLNRLQDRCVNWLYFAIQV